MKSPVAIWLTATVVWGVMDHLTGDSLVPLIGQSIFGATVLWMYHTANK